MIRISCPSRFSLSWPAITMLSPLASPSKISTWESRRTPARTLIFDALPSKTRQTKRSGPCGTMDSSGTSTASLRSLSTTCALANIPVRRISSVFGMRPRTKIDRPFASTVASKASIDALKVRPGSASTETSSTCPRRSRPITRSGNLRSTFIELVSSSVTNSAPSLTKSPKATLRRPTMPPNGARMLLFSSRARAKDKRASTTCKLAPASSRACAETKFFWANSTARSYLATASARSARTCSNSAAGTDVSS